MRSLRTTLILGTSLSMVVLLLAAGAMVYGLVHRQLLARVDASLLSKARILAETTELEDAGRSVDFESRDEDKPILDSGEELELLVNDELMFRSIQGSSFPWELAEAVEAIKDEPVFFWMDVDQERKARGIRFRFDYTAESEHPFEHVHTSSLEHTSHDHDHSRQITADMVLTLVTDTQDIFSFLASLRLILISIGVVTLLSSGLILWLVVSKGVRPLGYVADRIGRLDEFSLSERVDTSGVPDELMPVVIQFNALLARLSEAFQRERTFTGDIAHELRTPLAGLRSTLEVAISRQRQASEYQQSISDSLEISKQLQTLVENLLSLVRLDAEKMKPAIQRVEVSALLRQSWEKYEFQAQRRGVRIQWESDDLVQINTDPILLEMVIRNLLENAVEYVDEGGQIIIESRETEGYWNLIIRNTGSRLTQEQAQQAFLRCWRGDESRTNTASHCGLGLTLVEKITGVLGGHVGGYSEKGGWFKMFVKLPQSSLSWWKKRGDRKKV